VHEAHFSLFTLLTLFTVYYKMANWDALIFWSSDMAREQEDRTSKANKVAWNQCI